MNYVDIYQKTKEKIKATPRKKLLIYAVAAVVVLFSIFKLWPHSAGRGEFKTAQVIQTDITESITASGTINPLSTVSIGTQASGRIAEIYVDYNSEVKEGQLLALIDQDNAKAAVAQREASLEIAEALRAGIIYMNNKLHGFSSSGAVMTGVQTRSSSPVRIVRDENMQSNVRGIFPCGEGAGYAGGITSAAADGLKAVYSLCEN